MVFDDNFRLLPTDLLIRIDSPTEILKLRSVYKSHFGHFPEDHFDVLKKELWVNSILNYIRSIVCN